MLENEVDSLKAEVDELRASFSTVHVKLANQQNLFCAAFRALNNPQKQSDVLFNVFIKPNYQSKLKVKSDYTFQDNYQPTDSVESDNLAPRYPPANNRQSPNKTLLKLIDQKESNTQSIKQTYDVISNNYLNNPNFFNDYPIYVPRQQQVDEGDMEDGCELQVDYMVDVDELQHDADNNKNESCHSIDSGGYLGDVLSGWAGSLSVNDLD